MSENTTLARPYSKAIFEHALASAQLAEWSVILFRLAEIVSVNETLDFINNPASTAEQQVQLLLSVLSSMGALKDDKALANLLNLLAANKRLLLLPQIAFAYETLKAEQEKTIEAKVISFSALTPSQEEKLAHSLSQRLQRKVSLRVSIDPSILGGAKISAGDLVIDGSIRGQLIRLGALLA